MLVCWHHPIFIFPSSCCVTRSIMSVQSSSNSSTVIRLAFDFMTSVISARFDILAPSFSLHLLLICSRAHVISYQLQQQHRRPFLFLICCSTLERTIKNECCFCKSKHTHTHIWTFVNCCARTLHCISSTVQKQWQVQNNTGEIALQLTRARNCNIQILIGPFFYSTETAVADRGVVSINESVVHSLLLLLFFILCVGWYTE